MKAPGYGDRRKAMLEDIAILTGGHGPVREPGHEARERRPWPTWAGPRRSSSTRTTRRSSRGPARAPRSRAASSRSAARSRTATSDYDREKLEERLAKLAGGVAKINVGAATESEMKEKKARVEDALHATRAAVEEGILPGGGVALLRAAAQVKPEGLSEDEMVGYNIVLRACRAPVTQIAANAGQDGSIVCEKVLGGQGQLRLQRRDGRVRGPGQGRRHRPDQGHPHRPAERHQRLDAPADQRRPDRREAQGGEEGRGRPRRRLRHVLRQAPLRGGLASQGPPGYARPYSIVWH